MFLDAVSREVETPIEFTNGNGNGHQKSIFLPWQTWEPSQISHHGSVCCELAREWLFNTDMSSLNGGSLFTGPRWLRQRFEWGPGLYPIHWCGVLNKKALDCGVHAALAHEVFLRRGLKSFRAQLVQEFSGAAGSQWRSNWEKNEAMTAWIDEDRIYHEGCAVLSANKKIKVWDPSAGWWIDARTTSGYGSVLALRLSTREQLAGIRWGSHELRSNEWITLS